VNVVASLPSPLEYVIYELRRQLPLVFRAVDGESSGALKALPTDIHIAVAAPLRHLHREVFALLKAHVLKPLRLPPYAVGAVEVNL